MNDDHQMYVHLIRDMTAALDKRAIRRKTRRLMLEAELMRQKIEQPRSDDSV